MAAVVPEADPERPSAVEALDLVQFGRGRLRHVPAGRASTIDTASGTLLRSRRRASASRCVDCPAARPGAAGRFRPARRAYFSRPLPAPGGADYE